MMSTAHVVRSILQCFYVSIVCVRLIMRCVLRKEGVIKAGDFPLKRQVLMIPNVFVSRGPQRPLLLAVRFYRNLMVLYTQSSSFS